MWPIYSFKSSYSQMLQNNYFEKSCKSHRKITVVEFFFSEVAGSDFTKRGLHHRFIWVNFLKFLRPAFFYHLWANTSVPFRPLWDFTNILKEVTVFLSRFYFDSCPCSAAQPQQLLFCLLNKYRMLTCSHSELFYEIALPKKFGIHFGKHLW